MAIPNHKLGEIIGTGGMATVYKAEHVLLKQERAIKLMSPGLSREPGFQESFIREGQVVAALRYPHIITIHDIGCCDEGYFMTMEYLSGGSLKDRLDRGPLPLSEAVTILRQIGEAMHQAHEQGLIHRDIKPANILFRANGDAVLTDFGISKLQNVDSDLTRHGYTMVGTPRYMSPEQTASQALDRRSDIYSLALLFYEMLTGKTAIQGDTTLLIIREHALAPPPALPDRYAQLQPVLNKALAKQPKDRYSTTLDFVRAVECILGDLEKTRVITGGRTTHTSLAGSWRGHVYYLVPVLLVAGVALWTWFGVVHETTTSSAPAPSGIPQQKTGPQDVALSETDNEPYEPPVIERVTEPTTETQPLAVELAPQPASEPQSAPVIEKTHHLVSELRPMVDSNLSPQTTRETPAGLHPQARKMRVRVSPYAIVYRQPGGSERLGAVIKGAEVEVYGAVTTPDGREWKKVAMDGREGFLKAEQLAAASD